MGEKMINEGLIHRLDHENSLVYSLEEASWEISSSQAKEKHCDHLRCLARLEDDVDVCLSL